MSPASARFSPVLLVLEPTGGIRAVSAEGTVRTVPAVADLASIAAPGRVVVSPPSVWCLAAGVAADDLPKGDRQAALHYRLEERLPWDAESFAAAFILHAREHLGLAIEHARIAPVLAELEQAGWQVEALVPWPILAATAAPQTTHLLLADQGSKPVSDTADHAARIAWVTLEQRRPSRWLQLSLAEVGEELTRLTAEQHVALAWHGPDAPAGIHPQTTSPLALAAAGAVAALRQPLEVPGDLRTGALAKGDRLQRLARPLTVAWLAACLLLVLTAAVFWQRAAAHRQAKANSQAADRQLYQSLHPGEPIPLAPGAALDAMARSLPAAGQVTDDVLPPLHAALQGLGKTSSQSPGLRVDELQLRPTQVFISGQAPSATELATLAQSLGAAFELDAPRSERQAQGVQFTLTGKPKGNPTSRPGGVR